MARDPEALDRQRWFWTLAGLFFAAAVIYIWGVEGKLWGALYSFGAIGYTVLAIIGWRQHRRARGSQARS